MASIESTTKNLKTEILIVGGGPAAFSAGIYAARAGRQTIILEGRAGSRLSIGYDIENYPGFRSINSRELFQKIKDHALAFGAEIVSEDAIDFNFSTETKYIVTRASLIEAKAVILATGKPVRREKMIPGEERLLGMGVSYCATCDGPLYRSQPVAVVGRTAEAVEDMLALHQLGSEVHWIPGGEAAPEVPAGLSEKVRGKSITIHWKAEAKEISGEQGVERIRIVSEGREEDIPVSGCFIYRESLTSPLFVKAGLKLEHGQCLAVDRFQKTSIEGVFAAGDISCGGMQVVTAAGEGSVAAMQAVVYLRGTT
ncbi:MAG: FAD-dependent oxidoreductase [Candidatus Aminicenantales bacterium]